MKKNIVSLILLGICTHAVAEEKLPWYKQWFSGIKSDRVTISTMNYEQLCDAKERAINNNDHVAAIKYLERMAKECPNLETLATIVMELADLLFDDSKFTKAVLLYDQYIKSFPGRGQEYVTAYYKKILCSFYQTLEIFRDQSMTEQTLELCDSFLETCKHSTYEKDVLSIQKDCRQKLALHELYVADNYITQNKITSATRRLTRIREQHISVPDIEPQLLLTEIRFAETVGNTKFAHERRKELEQRFPEHQSVVIAQAKKPKNMAHRF